MSELKPYADRGMPFIAISQFCCAHGFGERLVMYPGHPDVETDGNKATFATVPSDREVHPDVSNALSASLR